MPALTSAGTPRRLSRPPCLAVCLTSEDALASGDFGLSMSDRVPATTLILQALPNTILRGVWQGLNARSLLQRVDTVVGRTASTE